MAILSKEALLGATDLVTREVDLNPAIDGSVKVRSLPAAYSNAASSASLEMVTDPRTGMQTAKADTSKLEELQVLHGLIEPRLDTIEEVRALALRIGGSWQKIVREINEISGIGPEDVKRTEALFRAGGLSEEGVPGDAGVGPGNGRSHMDVPASA